MKVITTVVGSLQTNCYLLIDEATREAALTSRKPRRERKDSRFMLSEHLIC